MKELSDDAILETAKTFITAYWGDRFDDTQDVDLLPLVYDVRSAEPKKLIEHFKTAASIFNRAIEICERSKK